MNILYGGSFDPIHLGHVHLIRIIIQFFQPRSFFLLPTAQNPLKTQCSISVLDRFFLLKTQIEEIGDARISILDWETHSNQNNNYTVDSIRKFHREFHRKPTFLLGDDVFFSFLKWKHPKEILEKSDLLIISRVKSSKIPELKNILNTLQFKIEIEKNKVDNERKIFLWEWISKNRKVFFLKFTPLPISSTHIRKVLQKQLKIKPDGLSECVWREIKQRGLYKIMTMNDQR